MPRCFRATGWLFLVVSLSAQTIPAPDDPELDEAIELSAFTVSTGADQGYRAGNSVSATRIDTPIKRLPFSVSAFTEQFIGDIGARDLNDILAFAPGVTNAGREFGTGTTKVNVRGFESDPQRNGFPSAGYIDAATVARVEVVKGPASLLYGQIAPGGVVNYLSKRPGRKPASTFNVRAGSYDFARVTADINQPLVGERLLFRFNGVWENGFEWIEDAETETTVVAPVIAWQVTRNSTLTLDYQWFRRRETPQAFMRQNIRVPLNNRNLYPFPGDPTRALAPIEYFGHYALEDNRYNASSAHDYRRSDFENFMAEYAVKLGADWNLRTVFTWDRGVTGSYQHGYGDVTTNIPYELLLARLNGDYSVRNVFTTLNGLIDIERDGAQSLRRAQYTERRNQNRTWQVEAAGEHAFDTVTWKPLFGASYQDGVGDIIQNTLPTARWPAPWDLNDRSTWTDTFFPLTEMPENARTSSPIENTGIYTAHLLSFFDDRLLAVGGLRWSKAESQTFNLRTNSDGPLFETKKTTPQMGIGWQARHDLLFYGSYSESFTAGNRQLRTAGVFDRVAEPFLGKGYELGVKTDFLDGRISATLAAFALEQDNYTFSLTSINPVTGLTETSDIQGNTVTSNGVELDLTWSPTDQWQVYFSASYADTAYDEIRVADVAYLEGTQPESTARDRVNLWTRYNLPADGWWIGAGLNYTGRKLEISNNPFLYLPNQLIVDATVGYDFRWDDTPITTSVAWKNVTDEDEIPSVRSRGLPSRVIVSLGATF